MQQIAFWRDVSLIMLVVEAAVIVAPIIAVGYYAIKGLRALQTWLTEQFPLWQGYVNQARDMVAKYASLVTVPLMAVAAVFAAVTGAARALAPRRHETEDVSYYERC